MLQQALNKVSSRSASPLVKWLEGCPGIASPALKEPPRTGESVKSLAEMPGPSFARFAWDLFARRALSRLHELQLEGLQRYGPMWKASFGRILTVHVAEASLIEQILRQEGRHPMRSNLSSWKDYRRLRDHHYGLLTAEGEEWQSMRSLLAKHMLRPRAVEAYDHALNSVVTDLVGKLRHSRRGPDNLVPDVAGEFYRFGLEGISSVLFESRIGCLDPVAPAAMERLFQSINTMFVMTLLTMGMPSWLHRVLPGPWKTFCRCWDYMFDFAKGHIDDRLKKDAETVARGEKVEGRYITHYLTQAGLPMKTIYSNVTELLLAGVDTISSTMSWSLYELSRHPEVQASLREEVLSVLGGRRIPEAADVARMPFLKATVKEVHRLYPVIPANARVITEGDIEVGGYVIPKDTLITLCHFATSRNPAEFPNPDEFQPRRWLTRDQSHHPYASLPFGVGKRSCVGRRIAELEIYLAIARIVMEFEVKPDPGAGAVRPMTRTVLVPEKAINLQFIDL
ncbi:hypothetical protein CRUP_007101 [Coryphaenoides rupestris]|nr:hypothetical protein CRUP_007101 [Coryphaenoides rupestris]